MRGRRERPREQSPRLYVRCFRPVNQASNTPNVTAKPRQRASGGNRVSRRLRPPRVLPGNPPAWGHKHDRCGSAQADLVGPQTPQARLQSPACRRTDLPRPRAPGRTRIKEASALDRYRMLARSSTASASESRHGRPRSHWIMRRHTRRRRHSCNGLVGSAAHPRRNLAQ